MLEDDELQERMTELANHGSLDELRTLIRETDSRAVSFPVLWTAGWTFVRLDRATEAIPLLERCVQENPTEALAHRALGIAVGMQGDLDRAEQILRKSLELRDAATTRDELVVVLVRRGFREAEDVLREGIRLNPASRLLHEALADTLRRQSRDEEADTLEARARQLSREERTCDLHSEETHLQTSVERSGAYRLAELSDDEMQERLRRLADERSVDELIATANEIVGRSDVELPLLWHAGFSLLRVGCSAEAADAFRRCVSDDPDEPLGHRALGVALSRTGDFDGSVNALSRSLELDDAPYVRRALARTFIDRGLASAENVLREGLSLQPSHRERFEALAENLHTQGRAAEAAELEDRASELPTKDERIRSRRAKRDALDP